MGLRPETNRLKGLIRQDLEVLPFTEDTLRTVEDLIAYLRQDSVAVRIHEKGFLHAKCWLFYSDRPGQQMLFDRFRPVLAIVGSSNFTAPGLTSNRELNLAHKVLLDPSEVEDPRRRASGLLALGHKTEHARSNLRTSSFLRARSVRGPSSTWSGGSRSDGPRAATSRRI